MPASDYTNLRELSSKSLLARDPSGRMIVLKTLPSDCLLESQLNPNIADRLRRVREIAMTDVANLRGVARVEDRIVLVWDFVDGVSFDAYASDPQRTSDEAIRLVRELIHTVEHFHATGLAHGALHSGNVVVDSLGQIKLIDVSPLLFLDPLRDERAVLEMCRHLANLRHDLDDTLDSAVIAASESSSPMQTLSAKLSVPRTVPRANPSRVRIRRRSLIVALIVLLLGAGAAIGIDRFVRRNQPATLTPPRK